MTSRAPEGSILSLGLSSLAQDPSTFYFNTICYHMYTLLSNTNVSRRLPWLSMNNYRPQLSDLRMVNGPELLSRTLDFIGMWFGED